MQFSVASSTEKANIYPNPVTDNEFVVKTQKDVNKVIVLSVTGQIVTTEKAFSRQMVRVDLEKAKSGLYIVKVVYTDKTEYVHRLIVK